MIDESLRQAVSDHQRDHPMKNRATRWLIGSSVWMGSIYAMLSLRHLDLAHGHTVCGPWGCGGSTEDLLAVHAAWGAALALPTGVIIFQTEKIGWWSFRLGAIALFAASMGLVAIALHTLLVWLPSAPEHLHGYCWQRYGFVVVNMVDLPLVQIAVAGSVVLVAGSGARSKSTLSRQHAAVPETGA